MVRGVFRAALFVGLVLALWTLPRSAAAMPAGLCDDRGATAIAPPSLEAPDEAIQRARAPASSCLGDALDGRAAISHAHTGMTPMGEDAGRALPSCGLVVASPPAAVLPFNEVEAASSFDARSRIERPPRG